METHPYKNHFDNISPAQYLILGTFPPNKVERHREKYFVDYYFGNKGSLWRIINEIYKKAGFNFFKESKEEALYEILRWQNVYSVGIADTIIECTRKDISSPNDSDLIIEWEGYNHKLKDYILSNCAIIKKILFTSTSGCNSALNTFKIIMGSDIKLVERKLIIDLPSPSGSSNVSLLNGRDEKSIGLNVGFYNFICQHSNHEEYIILLKKRWGVKKLNKNLQPSDRITIDSIPKGLVKEYKIWKYGQHLPFP